jgi:hypothetical protein
MKKLTLNADPDVIREARRLAEKQGTSVSSMFARMIRFIARREGRRIPIGPLTRKATGLIRLPRGKTERDVLEEALLEKYDLHE